MVRNQPDVDVVLLRMKRATAQFGVSEKKMDQNV